MKWFSLLLAVAIGAIACAWVPLQVWIDMNQGLIAFLGFLAAALVQVIPVTANFIQSDRLFPAEAKRLSAALKKQQDYWVGLLAATVAVLALIIIVSASAKRTEIPLAGGWVIDVGPYLSGLVGFGITFVFAKMIGLFKGVLSLQTLRNGLVIAASERHAAEREEAAQNLRDTYPGEPIVPPDYGKIVQPH